MEIHLIEDRIRELCEKAAIVDDSEVLALFAELLSKPCNESARTFVI